VVRGQRLLQRIGFGDEITSRVGHGHRLGFRLWASGGRLFQEVGFGDIRALIHMDASAHNLGRGALRARATDMKPTALKDVEKELQGLDFSHGLTRDDVRQRMPNLPEQIYLDLPASKRYRSAQELVHEALNARNRAEGEIVREDFDAFDSDGAEDDGGPAAWGEDPILGTHHETS
jgi:hypothetical protein